MKKYIMHIEKEIYGQDYFNDHLKNVYIEINFLKKINL